MESCVQSWWPVSKVLCLPRKSEARSHKIIFPKLKIWCSKNPYKLAGGPRPTPSPSRTFPSHQWRLVRCAPTWHVQIQKQHRCLYNRIHHKVSVWSCWLFLWLNCCSNAWNPIRKITAGYQKILGCDTHSIFFQHFKIAHLVDRICVCAPTCWDTCELQAVPNRSAAANLTPWLIHSPPSHYDEQPWSKKYTHAYHII